MERVYGDFLARQDGIWRQRRYHGIGKRMEKAQETGKKERDRNARSASSLSRVPGKNLQREGS